MPSGKMHESKRLGVVARGGAREISSMRLELLIDGMVAVHARHAVFTALSAVEGIQRAEVELGRVVLELAPSAADVEAREREIAAAVEAVGFTVREVRRLPRSLPML
jgi:copper chaperone CopZ